MKINKRPKITIYYNTNSSHAPKFKWENFFDCGLNDFETRIINVGRKRTVKHNVQRDLQEKVDYIFCIGGDGTINAIIQELKESNIPLVVVPIGTANDLARELKIYSSPLKLSCYVKLMYAHKLSFVDLIKVNDKHVITNSGIGVPAEVIRTVNELRLKSNFFRMLMCHLQGGYYGLLLMIKLLFKKFKLYPVEIRANGFKNGEPYFSSVPILLINNQSTISGRYLVAPHTRNNDGKFNVLIYNHTNRWQVICYFFKLVFNLDTSKDKRITSLETDYLQVKICNQEKVHYFGDGEILHTDNEFKISILPKAVKVITGKRSVN